MRRLPLLVLLYVVLDFANPLMPGAVSFERFYSSNAYYRIPGDPAAKREPNDYWTHTYADYVVASSGGSNLMAAVRRPNGRVQFFDGTGMEIHNGNGAADRMQPLAGSGWRIDRANGDVEFFGSSGALTSLVSRAGAAWRDETSPGSADP